MSNPTRRALLEGAASSAVLGMLPRVALAQAYPSRPIKIISPYAAGGATDTMARVMGQWFTERMGAAVVVENKPGGGANIGTESVLKSPADGYVLLLASTANTVNATLFPKLNFNFLRDAVPVGKIGDAFNVLLVHPSMPVKTTADFIAVLKAKPGAVTIGLPGNGSPQHMSAELFKLEAGVDPVFVQYRGAPPVINDLVGGHINAGFASSIAAAELIKSGTLRALGVTTARRAEAFPEIPSISETIPGYEAVNFYGIAAPKGTPDDIVAKLNAVINEGIANESIKQHLSKIGVFTEPTTPASFAASIAAETEKWGKVVKSANLKPT